MMGGGSTRNMYSFTELYKLRKVTSCWLYIRNIILKSYFLSLPQFQSVHQLSLHSSSSSFSWRDMNMDIVLSVSISNILYLLAS
jgi:hypothetical protein